MSKVDPRDFLLNTDYEMDKIILFKSGTINAGQYDVRIQHGLSFAPLIFGVFAYTDDFSGPRPMPYQYITPELTIDVGLYSDPTNLYLSYHNSSGTPATIYYRIYAFEPSDSRSSITPTSGFANCCSASTCIPFVGINCNSADCGCNTAEGPVIQSTQSAAGENYHTTTRCSGITDAFRADIQTAAC